MPFQFADMIFTVIRRQEVDDARPPPPIPWHPDLPTEVDDLRAIFEHGLALLGSESGAGLSLPTTLTEVVALEQHLTAALREVRELKQHMAGQEGATVPDQTDTYDAGASELK